jgi:transposase
MGRPYDKQFKQQAVKLVMEQDRRPSQVARELGMPHSTLMCWLHKLNWQPPEPDGPPSDDPAVLALQVRDLRRQVKRLEMEKDILKKATAYFASQSLPVSPSSEAGQRSFP